MPKIAKPLPGMKGIYRRGKKGFLWLRYSFEGQQLRVPLGTTDEGEAIEKAKEIRNRPKTPKPERVAITKRATWKDALDSYITDKLEGKKSPFTKNKRQRTFRPGTATRTRDLIRGFGDWTCTRSPFEVTSGQLKDFYDLRKKKSVASAKTIVDRVMCFFEHIGHFPKKPEYADRDEKEIREVFLEPEEYNPLIEGCTRKTLKFVLFCGFHCGLRKAEIIYSRPHWFHLSGESPFVRIPAKEQQVFHDGTKFEWRSKNGKKTRDVPLGKVFAEWLRENLDRKALYCIEPEACGTWRYRYDFKKAFDTYVAKAKMDGVTEQDVTTHSMRHSYITRLCRSEDVTIMMVSEWSGDTVETIERHYWHRGGRGGGAVLDRALAGTKKESTEDILNRLVETMKAEKKGDEPLTLEEMNSRATGMLFDYVKKNYDRLRAEGQL